MAKITARALNKKWEVGALHALYRRTGDWYHTLDRFPGALFDECGFILFKTQQDYEICTDLQRSKKDGKNWLLAKHGIASIKGYMAYESVVEANSRLLASDADTTPYDPTGIIDARNSIMRAIDERRGRKTFRDNLLRVYGGRCAITGCDIIDVLEAAHVTPYLGPDTNRVTNGLLLRADLHTLLDCGLLNIDPTTHAVILAPMIRSCPDYKDLHGRRPREPEPPSAAPSLRALESAWAARQEPEEC